MRNKEWALSLDPSTPNSGTRLRNFLGSADPDQFAASVKIIEPLQAAKRRKNAAHDVSRGGTVKIKKPEGAKEKRENPTR
jgi:hypothetical protein